MSARSGDLSSSVTRYLARCERRGGCLIGPHTRYGCIRYDGGRQMSAHKASYTVHHGPVPEGMVVRHACDNPRCVEPSHLSVGTYQDNEDDKAARGRTAFGLSIPTAKVSIDGVREALELHQQGWTKAAIARRFGVGRTTVRRWVLGESRKDVSRWIGGEL